MTVDRLRNPYHLWLLLFTLGMGLDTLGILIVGPIWLCYGLLGAGVVALLLSIGVAGRLQRSE